MASNSSDTASASAGSGSSSAGSSSSEDTNLTTTKVVSGNLDGQSTAWFSTMCDGLSPLEKLGQNMSSSGTSSGPSAMSDIGKELSEAGKAMVSTAQKLAQQPPPTVSNGSQFAGTFIKALQTFGSELQAAGQKVAKGDTSALTDFQSQADSLSKELNSFKPTPDLQKQIEAIPSCKAANLNFSS